MSISAKIKVMLLKRRLVKYIDEFLDNNSEFSDSVIQTMDEIGIPAKLIMKRFMIKENIGKRKMIKLIIDCKDDNYIEVKKLTIRVTNKGRMFIKRYVFFGKALEQMNISAVYILFLIAGIIIGFIITYIIIPLIKLIK